MTTYIPTENPDNLSNDALTAACSYLARELPHREQPIFPYDNERKIVNVPLSIPGSFTINVGHKGTMPGIQATKSVTITREGLANTLGVDPKDEKALADAIVRTAYPENLRMRWTEDKAEALEAQWRRDILVGLRRLREDDCTVIAGHPLFSFASKAGTIPGQDPIGKLGSISLLRDVLIESAVKYLGEEQVREALGSTRYDQLMGATTVADGAILKSVVMGKRESVFDAIFRKKKVS